MNGFSPKGSSLSCCLLFAWRGQVLFWLLDIYEDILLSHLWAQVASPPQPLCTTGSLNCVPLPPFLLGPLPFPSPCYWRKDCPGFFFSQLEGRNLHCEVLAKTEKEGMPLMPHINSAMHKLLASPSPIVSLNPSCWLKTHWIEIWDLEIRGFFFLLQSQLWNKYLSRLLPF